MLNDLSVVTSSLELAPESVKLESDKVPTVGATVSIVTLNEDEVVLLPAKSVAFAVNA